MGTDPDRTTNRATNGPTGCARPDPRRKEHATRRPGGYDSSLGPRNPGW